jgi:hypothetical protein
MLVEQPRVRSFRFKQILILAVTATLFITLITLLKQYIEDLRILCCLFTFSNLFFLDENLWITECSGKFIYHFKISFVAIYLTTVTLQ